jgi:signal transduction histidine kinase
MSALYSSEGDTRAYTEASLDLYDALLQPRWELSRTQFFFYLKKVKENLDAAEQSNNTDDLEDTVLHRWRELKEIEAEKLAKMEEVDLITNRIRSFFAVKDRVLESRSTTFVRASDRLKDKNILFSYTCSEMDSILGFSFNINSLKNILAAILADLESTTKFNVQVVDSEQNTMIAGEASPNDESMDQKSYTHRFSKEFLPWEIRIFQTLPNQAERQFRMRRNIYVLSVLVVITAILLGGVLAIRSTGKELRLAKLKSEFVSTVSHEFRTPLMSIHYLADLLQRGRVKDEGKKQKYYESITHESERLSRLIENILDFSKIEAGMKEYEFSDTDLAEMCKDIISRFKDQVLPLEFTVESEIAQALPKISADKEALSRAVFNLLDNAVKYSGSSRTIKFRALTDENGVYLKVIDKGIGIKKEDQSKIFDKFFRSGDIQDSSIKGSGIGLTLVSHIVAAHGGAVNIESELGEGTKVTISLPSLQNKG